MLELPEVLAFSKQLNESVKNKMVERVLPPTKPHKFCWFSGDAAGYDEKLRGGRFIAAEGFGIYLELSFSNGMKLAVNDGVNIRLSTDIPKDYQLLISFTDGTALVFTVAMYGGIMLHAGDYDNEYYLKSRTYISPFTKEFDERYERVLAESKPSLSAKALIATEQRFPGIGNGTAQDILFAAGLHPKRKLSTLSAADRARLLSSIKTVLSSMAERGGRDTEKDLYGRAGGYVTRMSKNSLLCGCSACGGPVTKEAYLGGSVYYCEHCQPLVK